MQNVRQSKDERLASAWWKGNCEGRKRWRPHPECENSRKNILAQFHHPKIGFGPIVVKRHVKSSMNRECSDGDTAASGSADLKTAWLLLGCASFARALWRGRIGRHACLDEVHVATFKVLLDRFG